MRPKKTPHGYFVLPFVEKENVVPHIRANLFIKSDQGIWIFKSYFKDERKKQKNKSIPFQ